MWAISDGLLSDAASAFVLWKCVGAALLDGAGHVDTHEALARDVVCCHFLVEGDCGAAPFAQCSDDEGDKDRVLVLDGDFIYFLFLSFALMSS
jgi:hypothetical protein